jgi:hypothetical protein
MEDNWNSLQDKHIEEDKQDRSEDKTNWLQDEQDRLQDKKGRLQGKQKRLQFEHVVRRMSRIAAR